jgi:hypothetical protein
MIQPGTRSKRSPSPGRMSKIDSALARIEELTAEMRNWLSYLTDLASGRSANHGSEE